MITTEPKCNHGVYTFTTHAQAVLAFKMDKRLRNFAVPLRWITHWKRDYSREVGVAKLGYTVMRNVVLVHPKNRGKPEYELLVQCEEGYISKDEAIGIDWIPSPAEIAEAAREIRQANDASGNIRRAEMVGFDLHRVYQRPLVPVY